MNAKLKAAGVVVAVLLALGATATAGGAWYVGSAAEARLAQTFDVPGKDVPIPFPLTDAEIEEIRQERLAELPVASEGAPAVDPLEGVDLEAIAMERAVARGEALVRGRLPCGECHGLDGAGKLVVDAQPVWTWYAPNITRGGHTKDYTAKDWDRIVRHGVKPDGTPATMPAVDFMGLSDQEVSDLAAWFTSRPPVDTPQPDTVIGPVGKALIGLGKMPLSAELIDHGRRNPVYPPEPGVNVEFGAHVAATCRGCHGIDYTGGPIAQGPPDWPPAGNLTLASTWSEEQFLRVFREGVAPDGRPLKPPMADVQKMNLTDTELEAMYAFLSTLEAKPTGQ